MKLQNDIGVMHVILNPGGGVWSVINELIAYQSRYMATALGISLRKSIPSSSMLQEVYNLDARLFTYIVPIEFPNASGILLPPINRWFNALQTEYPNTQWITHFHNTGGIGFAFWPRMFPFTNYQKPSINTVHGIPPEDVTEELRGKFGFIQTKVLAFLSRQMVKQGVRLVTLGEGSRNDISNCYNIPKENISIVQNGVNMCSFVKSQGKKTKNTIFTVGFVGHLDQNKRWNIVAEAVIMLSQYFPIRLILAGAGKGAEKALALSKDYPDIINYIGEVKNAGTTIIPKLDVLVLPSLHEGQPMVILEALAAGVPIIASKVGSIPETIEHGVTGFLLETSTPKEVAELIYRLIENPDLHYKLGFNARKSWEERFNINVMAENYMKIYQDVLQNKKNQKKIWRRPNHE
jgi:glycosyltransferase involved in cell wall biosynthesis